jgi:hypothetical protein
MSARSLRSARAVGVVASLLLLLELSLAAAILAACNPERQAECGAFIAALKPLGAADSADARTPSVDVVDRVDSDIAAIRFQDKPLEVFAKNYRATLNVLSSTLKLQAGPSPPDGTDDVVKAKVKEVRTQSDDAARYCAQ